MNLDDMDDIASDVAEGITDLPPKILLLIFLVIVLAILIYLVYLM